MGLFAGLDWGAERHAACVVDDAGKIVARFDIAHDAEGLEQWLQQLGKLAPAQQLPIAIERPSGLIVDSLVERGHVVVPIHPNVVKACRPRYRAAGGKDDRGDAYLLADVLRTDGHRFRRLTPQSDDLKALRALVRTRDDLMTQRLMLANQLRALLESFWPGAAVVFGKIDSLIALAFIEHYPTPKSAEVLSEKRLSSFLTQHRYPGRTSVCDLLARLRNAPQGRAADAEVRAKGELVAMHVRLLRPLVTEIAQLTRRIEHAVAQLPDGRIVMSFPRAGRLNAAQILAELGDVRDRFPTEDQLAAEAGVCPITYSSGKSRGVAFRWACNKHLRRALTGWAYNSCRASPWAAAIYARARARGCDHNHAVRVLTRAWVRVLWRAWTSNTPYDPARHGGARLLQPAA